MVAGLGAYQRNFRSSPPAGARLQVAGLALPIFGAVASGRAEPATATPDRISRGWPDAGKIPGVFAASAEVKGGGESPPPLCRWSQWFDCGQVRVFKCRWPKFSGQCSAGRRPGANPCPNWTTSCLPAAPIYRCRPVAWRPLAQSGR